MIYNELPTAFPWYDKYEKQYAFRENVQISAPYALISPNNALLPFELLLTGEDVLQATKWVICSLDRTELMDLSSNISSLHGRTVSAGTFIFYNGEPLTVTLGATTTNLNLPPGTYYSQITFGTSIVYYSERFTVPNNSFAVNDPVALIDYIKVAYSNTSDLDRVMYVGNNDAHFTQVFYLDTFVHTSDAEVEQDGENDGDNRQIPAYQRLIIKYRWEEVVPDFLKNAIVSLQLHDTVYFQDKKGVRSGYIDEMTSTSGMEDIGAYSKVEVIFTQVVMTKHGCGVNMTLSAADLPINLDVNSGRLNVQVPSTPNSQIVSGTGWLVSIIPINPGKRYYINNWNSGRRELGFYGPGNSENPTSLPVISSSQVTKIANDTGAYTFIAPAGSAFVALNLRADGEPTSVFTGYTVWEENPGKPYLIRAQVVDTNNTTITGGITKGTWGAVYASSTQAGTYVKVLDSLTPAQLLAGVNAPGNYTWWKIGSKNYNTDYGLTPAISRTA